CFTLESPDDPAEDAQAVDHGRVRVGPDQRVRISYPLAIFLIHKNNTCQIFQIHLVNDSRVGGNNREVTKRRLPPAQERITLAIAQELQLGIQRKGLRLAELVNLNRIVT